MKKEKILSVKEIMRDMGAKGGRNRAKNHSQRELSQWGKMGGRPSKKK